MSDPVSTIETGMLSPDEAKVFIDVAKGVTPLMGPNGTPSGKYGPFTYFQTGWMGYYLAETLNGGRLIGTQIEPAHPMGVVIVLVINTLEVPLQSHGEYDKKERGIHGAEWAKPAGPTDVDDQPKLPAARDGQPAFGMWMARQRDSTGFRIAVKGIQFAVSLRKVEGKFSGMSLGIHMPKNKKSCAIRVVADENYRSVLEDDNGFTQGHSAAKGAPSICLDATIQRPSDLPAWVVMAAITKE